VVLNAFTVDVEEWFHICGVPGLSEPEHWDRLPSRSVETTERVLALLDRCGVRATCFIVGWVAARHPAIVARIRDAGHEIGCHGYRHARAFDLGEAGFVEDVKAGVDAIAAAGTTRVRMFRAPEWSLNERAPWGLARLVELGMTLDSSRAPMAIVGSPGYPIQPHCIQTPAGSIVEVPPFVARRFGQMMPIGGGWGMRMAAPTRILAEIARRNEAGVPVTLWLHPWELDPNPPRVRLPAGKRFAHYFRLDGLAGRLEQVLRGAPFGTISGMLAASPVADAPAFHDRETRPRTAGGS